MSDLRRRQNLEAESIKSSSPCSISAPGPLSIGLMNTHPATLGRSSAINAVSPRDRESDDGDLVTSLGQLVKVCERDLDEVGPAPRTRSSKDVP